MPKAAQFLSLLIGTIFTILILRWTHLLVFDNRQLLSISIFSMFIIGTLLFGEFRLAFAFGGIALLMAFNLLTVERFTQAASLDVIIFLIGTFLVIGYLEETQFFEYIVEKIVHAVGPRPQTLLLSLMGIASVASALVGEVTAVLFMAGAMLHLTGKYRLNPIPFIIMLVFACNNGSAMSSVGNPIGVLIALKTGLGFIDFLCYAAPTAIVVNVVTFAICRWYFASSFKDFTVAVNAEFMKSGTTAGDPTADGLGDGPSDGLGTSHATKPGLAAWGVLLGLIALLVTHKQSEALLGYLVGAQLFHENGSPVLNAAGGIVYGLREGTMLVGSALFMGALVLLIVGKNARELVERRVDWWTLSFFMMLFASVGTLQDTKVTEVIAAKLTSGGGSQTYVIQIVGWATGWLSAFLDNVLAVATFMPVVHDVRVEAGVPYSSSVYWFMLFGGTFMGNMTIIGSTANIVAVGLLEKRGHGTISFGQWMKIGFIVAIASMLVATAMLAMQSHWIPFLPPPHAG